MSSVSQNEIIKQYEPVVRRIAYRVLSKVPANIELKDLLQEGRIGLLTAHKNYVVPSEASFETFASSHIHGAMIDYLRTMDWLSRRDRRAEKQFRAAERALEHETGQKPKSRDIAQKLGISLAEYFETSATISNSIISMSLSMSPDDDHDEAMYESLKDPNDPDPIRILLDYEQRQLLKHAIDRLPEREKLVIDLHTSGGLGLKEIGAILGVTESRACQLHAQAVIKCQKFFKAHGYIFLERNKSKPRVKANVVALAEVNPPHSWVRFLVPREFFIHQAHVFSVPENLSDLIRKNNKLKQAPQNSDVALQEVKPTAQTEREFKPCFILPTVFKLVSTMGLSLPDDFLNPLNDTGVVFRRKRFRLPDLFEIASVGALSIPADIYQKIMRHRHEGIHYSLNGR